MNGITILIWITIALIAAIAIIAVKLHYRGAELEHEEGSILPGTESLNGIMSGGNNKINTKSTNAPKSLSPQNTQQSKAHNLFRKESTTPKNDAYIVPEVKNNNLKNFEYESQNQVLINYGNTVEKFQEPIKQSQMDIMTQNNDKDTTELKDLFTIDELIKESKRKDSEREKDSSKSKSPEEDKELEDIKESIKHRKENKSEEPLIEEIINEEEKKEETISDLIGDTSDEKEEPTTVENVSVASQKDIDEAIDSASKEVKEEIGTITSTDDITNILLDSEEEEEISEPTLKTPSKVDDTRKPSFDDATLESEDEGMDLDYRKDLDRFANKIKGSRIFQDVKEKLTPDTSEEITPQEAENETFIRNVNSYDEYEPIINETHIDFDEEEDDDQRLREANTRRMFSQTRAAPEPEVAHAKVGAIKDKPARDNIKIQLNNNEVVLKKGDEIIFNHAGETYSSQVFAINGDEISVKYRRKNIKIKPSDVKKIY